MIFAIVAPVAGLPFVAGQGIVIFLLDVGVPARGLEIVPPRMVRGLPTIGDTDPLTNPPADRFGAVSCPAAKSILGDAGKDSRFQTRGAASLRGCTRTRGDMGRPRSSLQKNRPPPPNSPAKRGAKWSIIGVQIGCDRGCKSRRNAGFQAKGRGFESFSLHRRVYCEPDSSIRAPWQSRAEEPQRVEIASLRSQ